MNFLKKHAALVAGIAYLTVVLALMWSGTLAVPLEQWDNVATAGWSLIPLFLGYLMYRGAQYVAAMTELTMAKAWDVRTNTKLTRRIHLMS